MIVEVNDDRVWEHKPEVYDLLLVLVDALDAGADVQQLVSDIVAIDPPEVLVCADGCIEDGDVKLMDELDKQKFCILAQAYRDHGGYSHHGCDGIFVLSDGRVISAHCGGCSCDGYGEWSFVESPYDALLLVPEDQRELMLKPGISDFTSE